MNKSMSTKEWGILFSLSMVWGCSYFLVSIALKHFHPLTIVTLRIVIAALILLVLLRLKNLSLPRDKKSWFLFLRIGLLTNLIPFCLLVWSQTYIAGGLASILVAATPIFTVLIAHLLTQDEKITVSRLVGATLGLTGVPIMTGTEALHGFSAQLLAELACLGAALCYTFGGIYGRRFKANGVSPLLAATGQLSASSGLLIPAWLIYQQPWTYSLPQMQDSTTLLYSFITMTLSLEFGAILCLAVFSTALAFVLYFKLLSTAGATNTVLVTLLVPVNAILLGISVLNETLSPRHYMGMILISLGLLGLDGRVYAVIGNFLKLCIKER